MKNALKSASEPNLSKRQPGQLLSQILIIYIMPGVAHK